MESKYFSIVMVCVVGLLSACEEESIGMQPLDSTPPGIVTDIKVENIPGGAILT